MTPLCELAKRFRTDKFIPHNYTPEYYRRLADRADNVKRVLEIGIGKRGGSLRMWEAFFPNAQVFGIDINPAYLVNAGRIHSFVADQADKKQMGRLAVALGGAFDVIVDDGAHDPGRQITPMQVLLPMLNEGGIYFIEDIKGDPGVIAKHLPKGFVHEIYEGSKPVPAGHCELLMIIHAV